MDSSSLLHTWDGPLYIGESPITQITHVRNKTINIQGRSPYVVKVIFIPKGTAFKGKYLLPQGANSFLSEKFPL